MWTKIKDWYNLTDVYLLFKQNKISSAKLIDTAKQRQVLKTMINTTLIIIIVLIILRTI